MGFFKKTCLECKSDEEIKVCPYCKKNICTKCLKRIILKSSNGAHSKLKSMGLLDKVIRITSFLDESHDNISWSQRFWHITHDKLELELCVICQNRPARFSKSRYKYWCCSKKCKSIQKRKISKDFCENNQKHITKKTLDTCMEKYGVEHSSQNINIKRKKARFYLAFFSYIRA